jgi:tetratricopeptide (TPR) repeat protein
LYEESLNLYRDIGDRWGAAGALLGLAGAKHHQGDALGAAVLLEESLSLFRQVGDLRNAALATLNLADALRDSDDLEQAVTYYREALAAFAEINDRERVRMVCWGLGSVLVRQGAFREAARLLGASSALAECTSSRLPGVDWCG